MSAPISVENIWSMVAPPTITTSSLKRLPFRVATVLLRASLVGVIVEEMATNLVSGLLSSSPMILEAGTSTPRSVTSRPAPPSMMLTRFFPMSWTSPSTEPMTALPALLAEGSPASWGLRTSSPNCMVFAAISIWGMKTLFALKSAPISSMAGIMASSRIDCALTPLSSASCTIVLMFLTSYFLIALFTLSR